MERGIEQWFKSLLQVEPPSVFVESMDHDRVDRDFTIQGDDSAEDRPEQDRTQALSLSMLGDRQPPQERRGNRLVPRQFPGFGHGQRFEPDLEMLDRQ